MSPDSPETGSSGATDGGDDAGGGAKKRRRRRGGRGRGGRGRAAAPAAGSAAAAPEEPVEAAPEAVEAEPAAAPAEGEGGDGAAPKKRRRRGRRGGARHRGRRAAGEPAEGAEAPADVPDLSGTTDDARAGALAADAAETADADAAAGDDGGEGTEAVAEAVETMTAPPAGLRPEQVEEIQSTPELAVDTRPAARPRSSAFTSAEDYAAGIAAEDAAADAADAAEAERAAGAAGAAAERGGDAGVSPVQDGGATPPPPPVPPGGVPRTGAPGGPSVMRPGVRPGVGRMSFSKGMGRHVFRPTGFRPPRPAGAVPPAGADGGEAGVGPSAEGVPPQPMPQPQERPPQGPTSGSSQHPMHRGPRPPQAPMPRGNQLQQGGGPQQRQDPRLPQESQQGGPGHQGGGQPPQQRHEQPARGEQPQRGEGQQRGDQRGQRGDPNRRDQRGPDRRPDGQHPQGGVHPQQQQGQPHQPHPQHQQQHLQHPQQGHPQRQQQQGRPPQQRPPQQRQPQQRPPQQGARPPQAPPVRVPPTLAHGAPGVAGTGHRGPQVIARAPEPAPDTVALPPVPEGTDLSETAALAPVPAGETAVPQPMTPQDAEALAPFAEDIEIEETAAPAKRREPTGRDMIINVVEGEEIRIAIVRRGQLEELYMERSSTESHVGNIYKGRVTNVEPSIQAAFIDFGIGKNGFLHISDLHPQYFKQNRGKGGGRGGHGGGRHGGHAPAAQPAPAQQAVDAESPVLEPAANAGPAGENGNGEPGPEQFASAYSSGEIESDELLDDYEVEDAGIKPMERVGRKTPRAARPPIQQCLRRGQEVIVQVTKEGIGTKGPTLTSYISCPGRYLVMMPGMSALGVSRKIEDEDQRRELRKILLDLSPPKNLGFIIRTAGTDVSKRELQGDLNYLVRMWKVIANRIRTHRAPVELYQESDLVIRTIRDVFNDEIDRIIIDNEQVASRVRDFLSIVNPRSAGVVELYTGTLPIFQKYQVEREIEKIHSRRVEMANGGSLVIDSAEALVAIDVNSGRYREQRDAELTAFNMNKEAVAEVCRQLRLRDLGGVVVIDFIDMREDKHKREIERLLKEELKNDRAKTKVLRMSQFCMIEMTRQRVRPSLKRSIYMDCPHCHGSALIKTPESVSLDVMRRVAAATVRNEIARIDVRVYPTVAAFVLNRKRKQLVELEERSGKRITVTADGSLAGDAIVIDAFDGRGSLLNLVL